MPKEYHVVDATNYRLLRDALNGVEGEICITTEGLLTYFNDPEIAELASNIRRVLSEFGGCWITSDPELNPFYMAALKALKGEAAFRDLLKTMGAFEEKSDTKITANKMTVLAFDFDASMQRVTDFLRSVGLKYERVPIANYLPELNSLADFPEDTKAAYKKYLEDVYFWIMTPDENFKEAVENYDGKDFGVKVRSHNGVMRITLRGRLDIVTAPELLKVYEKTAEGDAPEKIIVDASELDYISSAGLRVLLIMIKEVGTGNLSVSGQNETVQTIFEQTGFVDMIE